MLDIILNQKPKFISSDVKMKFNIISIKLTIIKINGKLFFFIYSIFRFEFFSMNANGRGLRNVAYNHVSLISTMLFGYVF